MSLEKDKLSRLSPQDRIKRLRELEDERKKELQEIDDLLKKSHTDLQTESLAKRITPPKQDVDIGKLFSSEEGRAETPRSMKEDNEVPLGLYATADQIHEDYESLKEMLDYQLSPEKMDDRQAQALDEIESRLKHAGGYVATASDQAALVSASRQALKRIKKYTGS